MINRKAFLTKAVEEGFKNNVSGYPLTLKHSKGKKLLDYKIYGNSVQDGTPTPDIPVEIQSVGEQSKNLFNIKECITGTNILDNGDGSITAKGYPSYTNKKLSQLAPNLKVGDEFVFSMETNGYHQIYLNNPSANYRTYISNKEKYIATQEMLNSGVYLYRQTPAQGGAAAIIKNMQIELGTVATNYEPYGYRIPIKVSGKNKFNLSAVEHTERTEILENGIKWLQNGDVDIKLPAGEYTISFKQSGTGSLYFRNGKVSTGYITVVTPTATYKTFKFDASVDGYLRISCFSSGKILTDIQIEEGTAATAYEPYVEPKTTNIYLDEPLRKLGEYADYIDFKAKKAVRKIKSKNLVATSTSGIGTNDGSLSNFYGSYNDRFIDNNSNNLQVLSDKLEGVTLSNYTKAATNSSNAISANNTNNAIFFKIKNDLINITEGMTNDEKKNKCNSYLASNPIIVNYILSTTSEQSIDLPEILTNKYTNIITVDTTIQPSKIETEYSSFVKEV